MRWLDVTSDPNLEEVLAFRRRVLREARCAPVADRGDYLVELSRGKKVLDVGVVGHLAATRDQESWLHRKICRSAATCLGIDVLADEIEQLNADGFNVRHADITKDSIDDSFDVIICGEVIEHLGEPAALFRVGKKLLLPGGLIVVTTPNPYYLPRVRAQLMGRFTESVDHAALLGPSNIAELAEREGMRLKSYRGVLTTKEQARSLVGKITIALRPLLTGVLLEEEAFCNTIIYECVES
jgi:2-polyprenyl-3-methyl-5-hydroxy-6-metoxy-1,4-benzoquinol methylase